MDVQKSTRARRWSGRVPSRPDGPKGHGARLFEILVVVLSALAVFAILEPWRRQVGTAEAASPPASAGSLARVTGTASVIDGDTLDLDGQRIRLFGIDAFETDQSCDFQACGLIAETALRTLVRDRRMTCDVRDTDPHGRLVSVCRVGETDIAAWIVEQGYALAYRRYSEDYVDEEDRARQAGTGAWAVSFDAPEEWRRRRET